MPIFPILQVVNLLSIYMKLSKITRKYEQFRSIQAHENEILLKTSVRHVLTEYGRHVQLRLKLGHRMNFQINEMM